MPDSKSVNAALARGRLQVERAFAERAWAHDAFLLARDRARERSLRGLPGWEAHDDAARAVVLDFAAELLAAAVAEPEILRGEETELIDRLCADAGLPRMALAREALRSPTVDELPPTQALETQLRLLLALAPLQSASLWTAGAQGAVNCVLHAGADAPSSAAHELAAAVIAGTQGDTGARAELFGLPIRRASRTLAALVACCEPRRRDSSWAMISAALPTLATALERDGLLARNAASERALVETSERRLTRLGFDLHDGPLQELLMLGEDLRLFRDQLGSALGEDQKGQLLRGRLDDLQARLIALEGALRRISTSVHAHVHLDRPIAAAIDDLVEAFVSRTGVQPSLALEGEATPLSASQRIALLSVLGEALNNVREHSDAREVAISVSLNAAGTQARVLDDGRGFDVEAALLDAAQRGRIGLAGIHERVRLLGGQCMVESRPGGPTAVSLVLPRWEPLSEGKAGEVEVA